MTVSTIAVRLPEPLYRRLEGAAAVTHRTVDELLAETIAATLPPAPDLPEALAHELAEMVWLSDEALGSATRPSFTSDQQKRLAALNNLEDDRPLTGSEKAEQAELLAHYEGSVLRRAQAFAVLARRGHRIPSYTELPLPV